MGIVDDNDVLVERLDVPYRDVKDYMRRVAEFISTHHPSSYVLEDRMYMTTLSEMIGREVETMGLVRSARHDEIRELFSEYFDDE